jgi:hypothetical protein
MSLFGHLCMSDDVTALPGSMRITGSCFHLTLNIPSLSHLRLSWWGFQQVENCRAANQRAVEALQKYGATRVECQPDGTLAYPGAPAHGNNGHGFLPEPLTLAEELVIRRFYEQKIQQVSAAFSFPNKIQV